MGVKEGSNHAGQRKETTLSSSLLNDMNHLNKILREQTQENLFLGTRSFE